MERPRDASTTGPATLDEGLVLLLEGRPVHAFAGAEHERAGNCHFAGEHTSHDFQGYLQGAVETGERAAGEILKP